MKTTPDVKLRGMLSVQAEDRVGIVARVTRFLHKHRANVDWMLAQEERRHFRVDCCFEINSRRWDMIAHDCEQDLIDLAPHLHAIQRPHTISIVSLDQEGIVAEASSILARFGCNILMLQAHDTVAPMCGHELFELEIISDVPQQTSLASLEEAFEAVANTRTWHVKITHESDSQALRQLARTHEQNPRVQLTAVAETLQLNERN